MSDTSERVPMSSAANRLGKLCRMLRNTLRSYPKARLLHGKGGFGVSLDDSTAMYIRCVGQLTPEATRDLLVLFATWCAVDPARLFAPGEDDMGGVSSMARERQYLLNGRIG